VPYVCTAVSGALVLVAGAGFTLGSAESAPYRWIGLAVPLALASIPVAVFLRSPPSRFVVVTLTAALVFADALQNVSVFWHGYVVSSLPAGLVRLALATALAGGAVALVVVLTELFSEKHGRQRPQPKFRPRSQPKLAIPKGKVR
jgi:hypothetical protein